jgi:hypothetical protein
MRGVPSPLVRSRTVRLPGCLYWRVGGRRVKKTVRGARKDAEAALTALLAARDRGEHRAGEYRDVRHVRPRLARRQEAAARRRDLPGVRDAPAATHPGAPQAPPTRRHARAGRGVRRRADAHSSAARRCSVPRSRLIYAALGSSCRRLTAQATPARPSVTPECDPCASRPQTSSRHWKRTRPRNETAVVAAPGLRGTERQRPRRLTRGSGGFESCPIRCIAGVANEQYSNPETGAALRHARPSSRHGLG